MKRLVEIAITLMVLIAGYFALRGYASWQKPFTWEEMDWNSNGDTTLSEFFQSSDVGVREIEKDGKTCKEYYAYKDGLPLKVICP